MSNISILCAEGSHEGMRRDYQTHPCKGKQLIKGHYYYENGGYRYQAIPPHEQKVCQCDCHERRKAKKARGG